MNIYDYFSSKDIADYCEKTGHSFNPLEMAVIVAHNDRTRKERHMAWRQIIEEYPDMPIPGRSGVSAKDSLHDSLMDEIAWEEKWIENFYTQGDDIVYLFNENCYSSVEKAWIAINDDMMAGFNRDGTTTIYRDRINGDNRSWVTLDSNGEVVHFGGLYSRECPCNLYYYLIYLPMPFETGDLAALPDGTPFVLKDLLWQKPEYNDFFTGKIDAEPSWGTLFHYYSIDGESGRLCFENGRSDDIWRLRYFEGELCGRDRFLKYLSQYIKNGYDRADWLINAFLKFKTEADCEDMKRQDSRLFF